MRQHRTSIAKLSRVAALIGCLLPALATVPAAAQSLPETWDTGVNPAPAAPQAASPADGTAPATTTTIPRNDTSEAGEAAQVRLVAILTNEGQRIDKGVVWRIYSEDKAADGKVKLVSSLREASPLVKLQPGSYVVNAAYGRANLTRKLDVAATPAEVVERFVLNAGGLRVSAAISGAPAPLHAVSYSIYSDRDQSDNRKLVLSAAKPGLIIRLNAGIYHIVSSYGDTNAIVESDVTVEAGKLTEAAVAHAAAKVTFKLVTRTGGEALADTQWTIQTPQGQTIKESMGALPSHILAPGNYVVVAKHQSKAFNRSFTVKDGETTQIEVLIP